MGFTYYKFKLYDTDGNIYKEEKAGDVFYRSWSVMFQELRNLMNKDFVFNVIAGDKKVVAKLIDWFSYQDYNMVVVKYRVLESKNEKFEVGKEFKIERFYKQED